MNEGKLYEAARSEAFDLIDGAHQTDSKDLVEAFVSGARWLMSLPLAERLSEEEKEKIRHLYLHYDDEYKDEDFPSTNYAFALELAFKSIFGKNLFNPTEQ